MEKIELAFLYYGRWARVTAKRSEVFSARGIVNLTDCGLNASSESAKPLVRYLQALETINPEIPFSHAVSKIGWRNNSLSEFVLPSTNCRYVIDVNDDGNITSAYRQKGELEHWLNFAKHIRQHPFARFLLAASFATPLLKILNERNFMVYLWGKSGGSKTAALYFATSVWGNPEMLMRTFRGTTNGIERAAEYSNDFPLAINERQVVGGTNKQELLETLVYMLESGRGKVRASRTGLRTMATWRTISMGTGEEPLSSRNSVQGVKTRIIEINAYPVLPNVLGKSVYSFTAENHGTAGVKYIEMLLQENQTDYHKIYEARRGIYSKLVKNFPDCLEPHIDALSMICTADFLSSMWLFGLSPEQSAYDACELAFAIAKQMPSKEEVSDTERAWQFVTEWLLSNQRRFEGTIKNTETRLTPEYGFVEKGYYNIYPSYLEEGLDRAGFRPNKIIKEFADKGLVVTYSDGNTRRFKIRVRHSGTRVYVIQIPIEENPELSLHE